MQMADEQNEIVMNNENLLCFLFKILSDICVK